MMIFIGIVVACGIICTFAKIGGDLSETLTPDGGFNKVFLTSMSAGVFIGGLLGIPTIFAVLSGKSDTKSGSIIVGFVMLGMFIGCIIAIICYLCNWYKVKELTKQTNEEWRKSAAVMQNQVTTKQTQTGSIYCPKCGQRQNPDNGFCNKCGAVLRK